MRLCYRPSVVTLLALTCCLLAPTVAVSQDAPRIVVGDRVRVTTTDGAAHVGHVALLSREIVELWDGDDGQPIAIPMTSVARLDENQPQSMAVVGVLVGAAVGLIGGAVHCGSEEDKCVITGSGGTRNDWSVGFPILLGVLGGAVGGVVGRDIEMDHWVEVPREDLGVSVEPLRDGRLTIGFVVRF